MHNLREVSEETYHLHGRELLDIWVCEYSNLSDVNTCWVLEWLCSRTLEAPMFLKSMPTSRVTPSPNLRCAAAICTPSVQHVSNAYNPNPTDLESVLPVRQLRIDRHGVLAHLLQSLERVVRAAASAAMTGTCAVLDRAEETTNDASRRCRGHGGWYGVG